MNVQAAGTMEDLSDSGARIRVNRPIPVKANVTVKVRGQQLLATVRYCTKARLEYIVGVEFQPA